MIYVFGEFELDARLYTLRCAGEPLKLEPKVLDVLLYLLRARDRVVSKDELLEQVWQGQVISDGTLTQCLAKARKAVNDDGDRQHVIKTQHGRGYRFIADVIERSDETRNATQLTREDTTEQEATTPLVSFSPVTTAEDVLPEHETNSSSAHVRDHPSWRRRWLILVALLLGGSLGGVAALAPFLVAG